jgi:hypothetical protein
VNNAEDVERSEAFQSHSQRIGTYSNQKNYQHDSIHVGILVRGASHRI